MRKDRFGLVLVFPSSEDTDTHLNSITKFIQQIFLSIYCGSLFVYSNEQTKIHALMIFTIYCKKDKVKYIARQKMMPAEDKKRVKELGLSLVEER